LKNTWVLLLNLFEEERHSIGKAVLDACIIALIYFKVAFQIEKLRVFGIGLESI
jgi:hypothetical protein